MERCYVADMVGEEYKEWKAGDHVVIATTTGSGKTTFVMKKLLKYAKSLGKHVVYLCNRRFLNYQVQEVVQKELMNYIGDLEDSLENYIHIRTYQQMEHYGGFPDVIAVDSEGKGIPATYEIKEKDVLFYIYDEAHYFVEDALFNNKTAFWYTNRGKIRNNNHVSVFLTATPEPLCLFLDFLHDSVEDICKKYLAMCNVKKRVNQEYWVRYLSHQYRFLVSTRVFDSNEMTDSEYRQVQNEEYNKVIEQCTNPSKLLYDRVQEAHAAKVDHYYRESASLQERYSYIDENYFEDIVSLIGLITESVDRGGKWLIFVQTLAEGKRLYDILHAYDLDAVLVSANRTRGYDNVQVERRSRLKSILDSLVRDQWQDCDVLITTSVLDSGISLHAKNVNNLVICQPNKTSFLQMLGRIRVKKERVNLYIKLQTPRQIKGYADRYRREFDFLVQFLLNGVDEPLSSFHEHDETAYYEKYEALPMRRFVKMDKYLIQEISEKNSRLKYLTYSRPTGFSDSAKSSSPISQLRVNELAIINYMAVLYDLEKLFQKRNKEDPYYYLKEQLSWIGKEYDYHRWIDWEERYTKLWTYLEDLWRSGTWLNQEEQEKLKRNCFIMLSKLRKQPEFFEKIKGRYNVDKRKYPGKQNYNLAFQQVGIPFAFQSRQMKSAIISAETGEKMGMDQQTYWRVLKREVPETIGYIDQETEE